MTPPRRILLLIGATSVALMLNHRACAHHNFAVHYDSSRVVTVFGVVTRYAYQMPHIEIDVKESTGSETKTWKIETINARLASTYDLKRDSLKVGDPVEIKGWPARDGSATLGGHQIAMPDGAVFVLRRSPRESPTRFRSIHGFTGGTKTPTPREIATNQTTADTISLPPEMPDSTPTPSVSHQRNNGDHAHAPSEQELDPHLEFIEQMEEGSFAVASLKELLEGHRSPEGQLAEIENLQVAMFNAKVLVPMIELSEKAKKHFGGDSGKARSEMKKSLLKAIRTTLLIEEQIVNGNETAALQSVELLLEHQHKTHLIFQ